MRDFVFRPGKIFIAKNNYYPCVIRNLSEEGAMARFEQHTPLPGYVTLKLSLSGLSKKAKVVWQDENDVGLHFLPREENGFQNAA